MEDHPLTLPQPVENYNQQGLPGQVCFLSPFSRLYRKEKSLVVSVVVESFQKVSPFLFPSIWTRYYAGL